MPNIYQIYDFQIIVFKFLLFHCTFYLPICRFVNMYPSAKYRQDATTYVWSSKGNVRKLISTFSNESLSFPCTILHRKTTGSQTKGKWFRFRPTQFTSKMIIPDDKMLQQLVEARRIYIEELQNTKKNYYLIKNHHRFKRKKMNWPVRRSASEPGILPYARKSEKELYKQLHVPRIYQKHKLLAQWFILNDTCQRYYRYLHSRALRRKRQLSFRIHPSNLRLPIVTKSSLGKNHFRRSPELICTIYDSIYNHSRSYKRLYPSRNHVDTPPTCKRHLTKEAFTEFYIPCSVLGNCPDNCYVPDILEKFPKLIEMYDPYEIVDMLEEVYKIDLDEMKLSPSLNKFEPIETKAIRVCHKVLDKVISRHKTKTGTSEDFNKLPRCGLVIPIHKHANTLIQPIEPIPLIPVVEESEEMLLDAHSSLLGYDGISLTSLVPGRKLFKRKAYMKLYRIPINAVSEVDIQSDTSSQYLIDEEQEQKVADIIEKSRQRISHAFGKTYVSLWDIGKTSVENVTDSVVEVVYRPDAPCLARKSTKNTELFKGIKEPSDISILQQIHTTRDTANISRFKTNLASIRQRKQQPWTEETEIDTPNKQFDPAFNTRSPKDMALLKEKHIRESYKLQPSQSHR